MAGSAVACAARQQGQRGLLAWRQALTEAQLCASAQQQAPGAYAGALLTPPPQQQQQQAAGFRSLPAAALLDRGCRRGSTHFNLWQPQLPCDLQASRLAPQHLQQQQQQWRGYAIGFAHYRPRRKEPMDPRRNLPQRNEQIQAAEVGRPWGNAGQLGLTKEKHTGRHGAAAAALAPPQLPAPPCRPPPCCAAGASAVAGP